MVLISSSCQHGKHGIDCIECYRLAYADSQDEVRRLTLQNSELREALKVLLEDMKGGPTGVCIVAAQKARAALGLIEKPKGVSPVDEHACATCGSAGLRDVSHAPCHPVAEKRKCECGVDLNTPGGHACGYWNERR